MDKPTQDLFNEVSAALAELAASSHEAQSNTGEISTTLAEMLDVLKSRKEPEPPQVNVTVQPAAVTITPAALHDFEVTHEYGKDGRVIKSHVKRITKG